MCFSLQLLSGLIVSVVIQVETGDGQKIVTIRSPLQVSTHNLSDICHYLSNCARAPHLTLQKPYVVIR